MNKKKIEVVSVVLNNFKNDSRVLKMAQTLENNGFDVTVVALHEELLQEYELVEDINAHRVKLKTRYWPKRRFVQLIKYFEFLFRVIKKYKNADVIHCNDLNALPVGFITKVFFNSKVKVVYDAHEYEINDVPYQSKLSIKLNYILERAIIKCADKIITVSDSIANEYSKLYGIDKPALVHNCPKYSQIERQNKFRDAFGIRTNQTIYLYQGALSEGRGIELLLEAFVQMPTDDKVIVFMGYGALESVIKKYAGEYSNIFLHNAVSPKVLLSYTASADFGVSFIEDSCLSYRYCLPNKMFEYLMSGIPVITSNLYEMKRMVEQNDVGVVAKDNTVSGFLEAINKIANLDYTYLVENIRSVQKRHSWETQEVILLNVYEEML